MNKRSKIILGTVGAGIIASGLIAGVASARPDRHGPPPGGPMGGMAMTMLLDQVDKDGDDKITKPELDQYLAGLVQRADRDGDGTLTPEEFTTLLLEVTKPGQVRAFQFFDSNGDGKIEGVEINRPADRFFARFERDGAIAPLERPHGGPDRGPGAPPPPPAPK